MEKMKQILALMLAVLMLVPALAACKQKTDETENEATITATPVKFSKSGSYTTTISSDKIKLDRLTPDNVEVRYLDPNDAPTDEIKEPTPEKLFPLAHTKLKFTYHKRPSIPFSIISRKMAKTLI